MTAPRETIALALFSKLVGAYNWNSSARRVKLWGDVPFDQRPALFMSEAVPETYTWTVQPIPKRVFGVKAIVYIETKDPSVVGASAFNAILDAFDAALAPGGGELKQTLGGVCDNCRITRVSHKDPGDLDGDGILTVDIEIIGP